MDRGRAPNGIGHLMILWVIAFFLHEDVIKWKHFPRYWCFVRGIPPTKASDTEV